MRTTIVYCERCGVQEKAWKGLIEEKEDHANYDIWNSLIYFHVCLACNRFVCFDCVTRPQGSTYCVECVPLSHLFAVPPEMSDDDDDDDIFF